MMERLEAAISKELGPGWEVKKNEDHFTIVPKSIESTNGQSLKSRLKYLRARAAKDHNPYIPIRSLYLTVTFEHIKMALSESACVEKWNIDEISGRIRERGLSIFSILVLIDHVEPTRSLYEAGQLEDHLLPFEEDDIKRHIQSEESIKDFLGVQWEFLALKINHSTLLQKAHDKAALPFKTDEPIKDARGNFGRIHKIEINEDHQYLGDTFSQRLVRKEVDHSKKNEIELKNLAILNHLQHPNIARLLSCYTYQHKLNLIFPFAEQGTLHHLLNSKHGTFKGFESPYMVFLGLSGLSSALENVHNYAAEKINLNLTGLHHDFRPKNILISGNTFKLADFGLSRFKDVSEPSGTTWKDTLGSYIAPECKGSEIFERPRIGRKSEIWAFGCMLTEVATWILLGPEGISTFQEKRRFQIPGGSLLLFHCGPDEKNPAVEKWLNYLSAKVPPEWKSLIDLIKDMLSLDQRNRPETKHVTTQLRMISILKMLSDIEKLLDSLVDKERSIDAKIELWRLLSWKKAIEPDDLNEITHIFVTARQGFEKVTQDLREIIRTLNQMKQEGIASVGSFRPVTLAISNLSSSLGISYKKTMDQTFHNLVLNNAGSDVTTSLENIAGSDGLDKELRLQVSLKFMTQLDETQASLGRESQRLAHHSILNQNDHGEFSLGEVKIDGKLSKVLIEWRSYGQDAADETINQELFKRVGSVACLMGSEKPAKLRSLNCRGYFHAKQKFAFGMVYDFPTPAEMAEEWKITSLRDVIKPNDKKRVETTDLSLSKEENTITNITSRATEKKENTITNITSRATEKKDQPPLELRYKIASVLATAILEFHKVSWIHKNINPSNVVFFSHSTTLYSERFAEPYLIGFHHCRLNEPSAFSEGIPKNMNEDYQHPEYLKNRRTRYIPKYDYFSLGLVLLEIGLWRPLSDLVKSNLKQADRLEKIMKRVSLLAQSMGSEYQAAVKACLTEDVDQNNFERKVLARLDGISINGNW